MYFNDPSLYGATLPQREFTMPFVPPTFAQWQNLPYANIPWQGLNVPWQGYKGFVPQMFQQQIPPHFGIGQHYGQFGAIPYAGFQGNYGMPFNMPVNWFKNLPY